MDARTRRAARPARILMMASPERARDFGPMGPAGTPIIHGRAFLRQEVARCRSEGVAARAAPRRGIQQLPSSAPSGPALRWAWGGAAAAYGAAHRFLCPPPRPP